MKEIFKLYEKNEHSEDLKKIVGIKITKSGLSYVLRPFKREVSFSSGMVFEGFTYQSQPFFIVNGVKSAYQLNEAGNNDIPKNWTKNNDGSYDSNTSIVRSNLAPFIKDGKLIIKFNKVTGDFDCSYSKLTSLEGAPKEVGGYFSCSSNNLTSLEGCPKEVGEGFYCYSNNLTSLEGAPTEVGGDFNCRWNDLTSLEGCPKEVGRDFKCFGNKINFTSEDVRAMCKVKGVIQY